MITTVPFMRETMPVTGEKPTPLQSRKNQPFQQSGNVGSGNLTPGKEKGSDASGDAVSVELSVSREVFTAVDDFFNLGASGRFDTMQNLSAGDREQFFKIVAALSASGYLGYEELVVNKKIERHDVTTKIADKRVQHAPVYDTSKDLRR